MKAKMKIKSLYLIGLLFYTSVLFGQQEQKSNTIQICLLLDISSSMNGLVNQVQNEFWKTITYLETFQKDSAATRVEIGVLSYGTHDGQVQLISDFTADMDVLAAQLFTLQVGGGEEYCGAAIQTALDRLNWSTQPIFKCIIIAGNESFNQGSVSFETAIENSVSKDILVNTIFCGLKAQGIDGKWELGAELGNGYYMAINQDIGVTQFTTPFDNKLMEFYLNYKSTLLYQTLKDPQIFMPINDPNGNISPTYRDMVIYKFNKRQRKPDLIDDFYNSNWELDKIDKTQLPDKWQAMSEQRLKFSLLQFAQKRQTYIEGFNLYASKIQEFLKNKIEPNLEGKTLDAALKEILSEQLTQYGFKKE